MTKRRMTFNEAFDLATESRSNLNGYAAIEAMTEHGLITGNRSGPADRIARIARAAMQAELKRLDAAEAELARSAGVEPRRRR